MTDRTIHFPPLKSAASYETINPEVDHHSIVPSLEQFITDYGAIPQPHYALPIALWALATHCFEKFDVFGYLTFTSTAPRISSMRVLPDPWSVSAPAPASRRKSRLP